MNRIRLLAEQVCNQIAAGEVVERPASVVKELVENALDADARQISVEIQAGGRSLIRVTDDGFGMSRDDALLSLERHATSKIKRAEDLAAITSMGFRGEALPSIASVSRFSLTTRERETQSPEGTQIIVSGGKIQEVKAAGSAPGTTLEVRQLFYNLPARRKFLRSEETESAHILHYLTLAALAFPQVAFTFIKDGRLVWQLPSVQSNAETASRLAALRERLRHLYGDEHKLLPVDFCAELSRAPWEENSEPNEWEAAGAMAGGQVTTAAPQLKVWGYIGAPGVSRATREDQHLFVNRRPVENRGLNYSLLEGYHTSLMKGRYPVCCLFLEIDPAAVDVNIHPSKKEIKFHREFEIRKLMAQAVREALLAFHSATPIERKPATPLPHKPELSQPKPEATSVPLPDAATLPSEPQDTLPNFPEPLKPLGPVPQRRSAESPVLGLGFRPTVEPAALPESTSSPPLTPIAPPPAADKAQPSTGPVPLLKVPLRLIGVVGRLYVLFESDRGLVLLDQHAAHERILFEQMLHRLQRHEQAPSQRLLLPETVEVSTRDAAFLRDQLQVLTRLGVGLSEFGERTFLLDALPPFVKVAEPRRFVLELVDQLKAAGQEVNTLRLGEHVVAKTVCRHAVKAHDPLAGAELENLVEDLRRCAMPYTCPHGRPTLIEMSFRELEKKFGRVQ